mmetsp:Transcript_18337/g.56868  ORF Transcript_18337/g.56868 Transcript_18337/m.56868 type:complete len:210 (+) Transcript_18337:1051-1680(+)
MLVAAPRARQSHDLECAAELTHDRGLRARFHGVLTTGGLAARERRTGATAAVAAQGTSPRHPASVERAHERLVAGALARPHFALSKAVLAHHPVFVPWRGRGRCNARVHALAAHYCTRARLGAGVAGHAAGGLRGRPRAPHGGRTLGNLARHVGALGAGKGKVRRVGACPAVALGQRLAGLGGARAERVGQRPQAKHVHVHLGAHLRLQ